MIVTVKTDADWPQNVSIRASGQTLFTSRSAPFDLTLHLFDLKTSVGTESVGRLHVQLAVRNRESGDFHFVDWQSAADLDGLRKVTESVKKAISASRDAADIEQAGNELGRAIFEPLPAAFDATPAVIAAANENIESAKAARQLIHDFAGGASGGLPYVMLVSIVSGVSVGDKTYATDVIPVGMMRVRHPTDSNRPAVFLGESFALALAVPNQKIRSGDVCPAKWYVSMPKEEIEQQGPLANAMAGLRPVASTWLKSADVHLQSAKLDPLRGWLSPEGPYRPESFVFAYLGHHSAGALFLKESGGGNIYPLGIRRDFAGSSIVILNACSSAMDVVDSGTPVGAFLENRAAAAVATTSEVSGEVAAAYLDCFSGSLARAESLTVGQAHALSVQCLGGRGRAQSGAQYKYGRVALKYLLIGNPNQRICAPARKGKV